MHYSLNQTFLRLVLWIILLVTNGCKPTGNKIFDLTVQDMEGNEVALTTLRGKPVVVNFWATWCAPCRQEKPELEKARQLLEQEGISFICLSDEDLNTIQTYLRQKPDGLTYFKLPQSAKWLGVFEYPQTILINKDGKIVHTHTGYNQWSSPRSN